MWELRDGQRSQKLVQPCRTFHTSPEIHQAYNIAGLAHTKLNASKARDKVYGFQDSPLSTKNEIMLGYKLF